MIQKEYINKAAALAVSVVMGSSLCACTGKTTETSSAEGVSSSSSETETAFPAEKKVKNPSDINSLIFDSSAWNYDPDNNVYWQIGVVYCADPQAEEDESFGIYVPGDYMAGKNNGDGTYTCTLDTSKKVGKYTAETAPVVMPINTGGYAAQTAPQQYRYDGLADYLNAGFVYVYAGCRGKESGKNEDGSTYSGGAPWGVTDLKAAVRYLRYNDAEMPGDTDKIFTFGHSGGGAQSSLMGATGDSELYYKYLENIGAVMKDDDGKYISDAVCGSMCWCPITNLDLADESYEWMMGQYSDSGTRADTTWTSSLSDDMAKAFADYINTIGLKDEDGNVLKLEESSDGIYTGGSYYDHMLSVIETSLDHFLADTAFPYTSGENTMADGGFAGGSAGGSVDAGGQKAEGTVTYNTLQDYLDALNSDGEWIKYDASANTAKITSIKAFVQHCKKASKDVGAFDSLNLTQPENMLFGNEDSATLHFDSIMAALLQENGSKYASFSDYDTSYVNAYAEDMDKKDSLGTESSVRQNMYNPMYYICDSYEGCGTSKVAKYWRINTGIDQEDTSLATEMDLALALQANADVSRVDFTTVWGMGHTMAERTGTSSANLIAWVENCCPE